MVNSNKIYKNQKKTPSNLPNMDRSNSKTKVVSNIKLLNSYYTTTYSMYIQDLKEKKGLNDD